MSTKWNNTVFNIIFWLAYFLYVWLTPASIDNEYQRYLINVLAIGPISATAAVFTVHVLFRMLYRQNKRISFWIGLFVSMFYLVKAWYEQERLSNTLKQEKTDAELKLLKSQVQPHFILNTLNNIYSYAIQKNEKTPDLILQLSAFLSYGLYESKPEMVPLEKTPSWQC